MLLAVSGVRISAVQVVVCASQSQSRSVDCQTSKRTPQIEKVFFFLKKSLHTYTQTHAHTHTFRTLTLCKYFLFSIVFSSNAHVMPSRPYISNAVKELCPKDQFWPNFASERFSSENFGKIKNYFEKQDFFQHPSVFSLCVHHWFTTPPAFLTVNLTFKGIGWVTLRAAVCTTSLAFL